MRTAIAEISKSIQVVVTMPNADTLGSLYRKELNKLKLNNSENIVLVAKILEKLIILTLCIIPPF